eukprot:CAMPEP_0197010244 /NCGR_PEP_ID=MMETSP1380-20130617/53415_1 /TAXON_ID=5936 /ORGANISM="Euplotes crassus, Strain CT5" /LENGTH=100 /DNA_ID=CAMNT_0042432035 /DNA_START=184 /DNA_END=483 /DNA_ORIENTATION=-
MQLLKILGQRSSEEVIFTTTGKENSRKPKHGTKFRGSNYRGVSANGKSWQVFIVIGGKKSYAGTEATQEKAAALYDKLAIAFHGMKAKTNFSYTKFEVCE